MSNNCIDKINTNLDNYYLNPYKYKYNNTFDTNINIDNNDLNSIIQTLTSIIMSNDKSTSIGINYFDNGNGNGDNNEKKKPLEKQTKKNQDNSLFKLIANNKINELDFIIKNENPNLNIQDSDGDTPLHISIFLCNYKASNLLISNGALINIKDKWGQISLHRICFCIGDVNVTKIINLFNKYQKQINLQINDKNIFDSVDNFGNTPFHLVLKYLIKNNVEINNYHIKLINKLKLMTNNKIKNKDNYSIHDLLKILNL